MLLLFELASVAEEVVLGRDLCNDLELMGMVALTLAGFSSSGVRTVAVDNRDCCRKLDIKMNLTGKLAGGGVSRD